MLKISKDKKKITLITKRLMPIGENENMIPHLLSPYWGRIENFKCELTGSLKAKETRLGIEIIGNKKDVVDMYNRIYKSCCI